MTVLPGENTDWKKNIALFLTGQAVSLIGSSIVSFAIMWHVTLKTGSGTMMMIFTVAVMLPTFFIAPFGGVWADNFNRKILIILSDGFIAVVTLVIAISYSLGIENLWVLLLCSVARSLGQGVQMPAINSLIPQIVPNEHLLRINGINSMIMSISMLGTPALAGALLTFFPIHFLLYIDVVTATAGILILIFFVWVPDPEKAAHKSEKLSVFADLKDGLSYILDHPFLKRFFIIVALFTFFLAPIAFLTPLQVTRNFGPDVWRLTVIEIAFAAGMGIGGLLMSTWGGLKNKTYTIGSSFLLSGIVSVGLGITRRFPLYSAFMLIDGITAATGNTPAMTVLQQKVDPEYMGRVFSIVTMISSVVMPLGTVVFGPMADQISLDWIIIATGVVIAALGLYLFADKMLVEAGR
jgi:DHA3 family macrolide efflux protein-like MFS transporter